MLEVCWSFLSNYSFNVSMVWCRHFIFTTLLFILFSRSCGLTLMLVFNIDFIRSRQQKFRQKVQCFKTIQNVEHAMLRMCFSLS